MNPSTTRLPAPGSLVKVRNEVWIVTSVIPGQSASGPGSHLVKLLSVSEDGRGETAEVIWETEPGRQVLDAFRLPEPTIDENGVLLVDNPRVLDAFLNAARWGAITNADNSVLASPFRSGIDLVDYQFEPLVRALDMSRVALLIADDVGLGKTIEAGLVLQEMELRHRIRSCLIVCPAGLQDKWEKEMRSRFGLSFRILDSAFAREARKRDIHLNPLTAFPYLITSIDWLKRPERGRILDDAFVGDPNAYPRPFDLLLVDEAHLAAPAGHAYSLDSDRTGLIRRIAPYFEHRLFVTATPHNGHSTSFWALLELLDPRRFDKNTEPSQADIEQIMVRRLKADIRSIDPDVPFPERRVHAQPVRYLPDEAEAYGRLVGYLDRLEEVNRGDGRSLTSVRFIKDTLKKRLLSSPAAFASTILQHAETISERGHQIDEAVVRDAIGRANDDYDTDEAAAEAIGEAVTLTSGVLAYDSRLKADLDWLVEWGAKHARADSGRLRVLLELIGGICGDGSDDWTAGRLLAFTEYRDTQDYLYEKLIASGIPPHRLAEINGDTDLDVRVRIAELFNHPPGDDDEMGTTLRILLCTDTASEGIDLHLQCHHLLHYDVPWNPSRMEQRNGRIDRYGQPSPTADVYHFTGVGDTPLGRDTRIEERVAAKLSNVVNDLGGANPLFGRLEAAHHEALRGGGEAELERYDAEVQAHRAKSTLRVAERRLRGLLEDVRLRLQRTRDELEVWPDELAHTVNVALELSHQPSLQPVEGSPGLYHVPALSDEWADTLRDLIDPVTGARRYLTFTPDLAKPPPGPLLAHLNHPLVAHATALLRAQVWSTTTQDELHRVTSRYYDPEALDGDYDWIGDLAAVAHARVLITGADGNRLHEQVVARAARLRGSRWAQLDADIHADQLWSARLARPTPADQGLLEEWDRVADDLLRNLVARGERVAGIKQKDLEARLSQEIAALEFEVSQAAEEMRTTLEHLDGLLQSPQATLFDDDVADQLRFDLDRLNQRHALVRNQVKEDIERVRRRYSEQDVRVFPIAVTFLHPLSGKAHV